MQMLKLGVSLVALTFAASCAPSPQIKNVQVGDVQVRQVPASSRSHPSGKALTPDGALNVFIFIPVEKRPLEQRIEIVEAFLAQQGGCRLGTTDRATLDGLTRKAEGSDGRSLVAPIKC